MKKVLLSMVVALGITGVTNAQMGTVQVNAGLGFSSGAVPVYVGADYYIQDDISVGGEISYRSKSESFTAPVVSGFSLKQETVTLKSTAIGIMANGNYHFSKVLNIPSEFDVYAGASLGYYIWNSSVSGSSYSGAGAPSSEFGFTGQVGGRYFFSDKFAANLEFGLGTLSGGKAGITYKL